MQTVFSCGEKGNIYSIKRCMTLTKNARQTSIQSTGYVNGVLYVFYHDSIIQRYQNGVLIDEISPKGGSMYHANDAQWNGSLFEIVDTGNDHIPPAIRYYDPVTHTLVGEKRPKQEGWRLAAESEHRELGCIIVSVEDIDYTKRTVMQVSRYDGIKDTCTVLGTIPHWHKFVQGCAVRHDELWITTNDGGDSKTTRFLALDLTDFHLIHDLKFVGFGESEGLFCREDGTLQCGRNLGCGESEIYLADW